MAMTGGAAGAAPATYRALLKMFKDAGMVIAAYVPHVGFVDGRIIELQDDYLVFRPEQGPNEFVLSCSAFVIKATRR